MSPTSIIQSPSPKARPASNSSGRVGFIPPSHQVMVTGPALPWAGKCQRVIDETGADSRFTSGGIWWFDEQDSIQSGCRSASFNALNTGDSSWQAMSPSTPDPKSHQPRQAKGW